MEAVRRYEFSLLLLVLLLLAAVAGLAFIFGLFRDLIASSEGAGFLGVVAGAEGDNPLARPAFLVLVFFIGVFVIFFLLSQSRKLHWLAAALFILLLILIGTPLAAGGNTPSLNIGKPTLLENGLNVQLDQGGVVTSPGGLGTAAGDTSGKPPQSLTLSPEGGHEMPDTPVFRVRGAGNTSYLRVLAATDYDGRVWTAGNGLDFAQLSRSGISTALSPEVVPGFNINIEGYSQRLEDNITLTPITKPIPRWDVHFGGLEDYRKDPQRLISPLGPNWVTTDIAV